MKVSHVLLVLVALILLSGCKTTTRYVDRAFLVISKSPNIKSVHLTNGAVITFDENLGWYDAARATIDGIGFDGNRYKIHDEEILGVDIQETHPTAFAWIIPGVFLIGFLLLGIFQKTIFPSGSGCIVAISILAGAALCSVALIALVVGP